MGIYDTLGCVVNLLFAVKRLNFKIRKIHASFMLYKM